MKKVILLLFFILICWGIGIVGGRYTIASISSWYIYLNKPFFSPPNWLFAPVWTILYTLMGISFFLIWQKGVKTKKVRDAIYLFVIQLVLNAVWTPVFFGARNILLGLIIIIAMCIYIFKTIRAFSKIDKAASYLLWPYFAWVSFATILNFSLWILNK